MIRARGDDNGRAFTRKRSTGVGGSRVAARPHFGPRHMGADQAEAFERPTKARGITFTVGR